MAFSDRFTKKSLIIAQKKITFQGPFERKGKTKQNTVAMKFWDCLGAACVRVTLAWGWGWGHTSCGATEAERDTNISVHSVLTIVLVRANQLSQFGFNVTRKVFKWLKKKKKKKSFLKFFIPVHIRHTVALVSAQSTWWEWASAPRRMTLPSENTHTPPWAQHCPVKATKSPSVSTREHLNSAQTAEGKWKSSNSAVTKVFKKNTSDFRIDNPSVDST